MSCKICYNDFVINSTNYTNKTITKAAVAAAAAMNSSSDPTYILPKCNGTDMPIMSQWPNGVNNSVCYQYRKSSMQNITNCFLADVQCTSDNATAVTYKRCVNEDFIKSCYTQESELSVGEIAGIAVGSVVGTALAIGGCVAREKCGNKRNRASDNPGINLADIAINF